MRIYFSPCGIALGHAGRCIAIAELFKKRGDDVFFSTYGEAVEFVRRAGFNVEEVPKITFYEKEDGTFDIRRTLSAGPKIIIKFFQQIGAEINLIEHFKPDVVVSDSRLSSIIAAKIMGFKSVLILHQLRIMIPHLKPINRKIKQKIKNFVERLGLEILGSLWNLSNVIIVPDFPPPYTIAKANVVPSNRYINKLKLVGPIISKYPWDLPPSEEIRKKLGVDDRPLIFAAMSGTIAEKKYITEILIKIFQDFPDDYNIIVSKGFPNRNSFNNLKNGNKNLIIFDWVEDRYSILKACDLLITRGGHNTVSEAIYYGKPMIIIPTPAHSEHQGIAKSMEEMGLAKSIQQYNLSKNTLLEAINEILNSSEFISRVEKAKNFAHNFNAMETIFNIINKI
ncbi:MAG: glycosyltransferase [Candidatus Methanomethylicaceae archaeon]|nr:glycosyltransferase [Candidatus Verstraetearchaeota archaeon]